MKNDQLSLSERLADNIVELIRSKELQPGDALESSRELARRFEVTTPTVREALRRLEATEVIALRHGSGTYIGPGLERTVMSNPHRPAISRASILELIDARLVLEPGIAGHAARVREPGALDRLEAATANALQPPAEGIRPMRNFHVELAATTANSLLWETMDALLRQRPQEQTAIRFSYDDRQRDHAEHRAILEAVRAGNADLAERLTREHLTDIRAHVAEAQL